jgi:FkbM family methyltransferase
MRILKDVTRRLIGATPFKAPLVRWGALLPPYLKGRIGARILAQLVRGDESGGELLTNLGISGSYRVALRKTESVELLFGRPRHYAGERGSLRLAGVLARDCQAFVDVGSNLGYYVFYVRRQLPRVPIYFFEPNGELFDRIVRNVRANRLEQVVGVKAAVGRSDGRANFYVDLTDHLSSSLTDYFTAAHESRAELVDVITLDRFTREHDLRELCVKVDVENAEFDFIAGAEKALDRIRYLIMEVLGPAVEKGFVQSMITRHGFTAYYINDMRLEHSPDGSFHYRHPELNWLFCRGGPDVLEDRLRGSGIRVVRAGR